MELSDLRQEIDRLDRELVRLFCRRMQVCEEVAAYKREHRLPVLDRARELDLLDKVAVLAGEENEAAVRRLYETILSLSKARQERLLSQEDSLEVIHERNH